MKMNNKQSVPSELFKNANKKIFMKVKRCKTVAIQIPIYISVTSSGHNGVETVNALHPGNSQPACVAKAYPGGKARDGNWCDWYPKASPLKWWI